MRHVSWFTIFMIGFSLLGGLQYYYYHRRQLEAEQQLQLRSQFQKAVGLPNLAITSAARYLRHYSITDLATPFQDYPASMDHFPAGFAFTPPDYSNMVSPLVFDKLEK